MQKNLFHNDVESLNSDKITVLLVDDQPMIAEAVRRALEDEIGIEFHYCEDPTKAIKIANKIEPTIILQDLVMPDVDGLMMVKFFRVNKQTKPVPIIVLSTKEEAKIKSKAFSNGANDYIVKLPDKIELIARIRYHSKAYLDHKKLDDAYLALVESQKKLNSANKALEALSSQDGLTGIANRRHFELKMTEEWQRAIRNTSPLSLLMIDIDFFKNYNDSYGHLGGDFSLKEVALVIKKSEKRSTDLACRYGGEEFGLILPETSKDGAKEIAVTLLKEVQKKKILHKSSTVSDFLTISIGVATLIPKRGTKYEKLIMEADQALYKAKETGRNRVIVF